jgi:hypothetical protein
MLLDLCLGVLYHFYFLPRVFVSILGSESNYSKSLVNLISVIFIWGHSPFRLYCKRGLQGKCRSSTLLTKYNETSNDEIQHEIIIWRDRDSNLHLPIAVQVRQPIKLPSYLATKWLGTYLTGNCQIRVRIPVKSNDFFMVNFIIWSLIFTRASNFVPLTCSMQLCKYNEDAMSNIWPNQNQFCD